MKIHRLTLRNWRGVNDRETRFAAPGVTVVEGPNESGKSSLFEALDALLKHYDDSKKGALLAVKPVHADVGPEVEAEIETGPYRFVYWKRFLRKQGTKLEISAPSPATLMGREAHERVLQILAETLDIDLWNALRVEQGKGITQADLANKKSLASALDRAAGVARTGEVEESLFTAAEQEFQRYFTPSSGAPRKEISDARALVAVLEAQLADDARELDRLGKDVERSDVLTREVLDAKKALAQSKEQDVHYAAKLAEVERAEGEVTQAAAEHEESMRAAKRAGELEAERTQRCEKAREAARNLQDLVAKGELILPALERARKEYDAAQAAFTSASDASARAERQEEAVTQDFEFRKYELDLQQLRERKQRIDAALAKATDAQAALARNQVTDASLDKIRKAHLDHEKVKAALEAKSPELHVRALTEIAPEIDGVAQRLAAGVTRTWAVSGAMTWVLPGIVELRVSTGASLADLRAAATASEQQYGARCREVGVESLDAAVTANVAWKAAQADIAARDEKVQENLRDLTREQLERKVESLAARVDSYLAARTAAFEVAADFDAARDAAQRAKTARAEAQDACAKAERLRKAAQGEHERLREQRGEEDVERAGAKTAAELANAELVAARAKATDEELARQVQAAADKVIGLGAAHRRLDERLAAVQPEQARLLAKNAGEVHARAAEDLRRLEDEQIEVRSRLQARGEEGLAERRDETTTKLDHARGDLERTEVHAAAAKLLFHTLQKARDQSRRAYVAPLRDKLTELGRLLYGPTFDVEIDDDLQITQRTLEGRTLPYESLSGGAKEQLGVLARVACALLVAHDGGVPVLIDDALGYSDAARLQTLGAVLGAVGRKCQIVVLTCFPDRYRHIGNATVVKA